MPIWWTHRIARVRGVIAASISGRVDVVGRRDRCRRTPASRRSSGSQLAVAMKEWLTVMTSSPGLTPTASSARCSAVVQFETAQACGAPTNAANSRSNAATSGPCVIQPERMTRRGRVRLGLAHRRA